MTADASAVIARELEPGESLLWSGQPRRGIVFRGSDVIMIPFSIMWGGFAIFWESMVLRIGVKAGSKIPLFMSLWGVPFVLIGLYLIFGRFIVDARMRENTYYGLTDRRVIIVTGLFDRRPTPDSATLISVVLGLGQLKVKSLDLRTMSDISMTERSDGSGTIMFGAANPYSYLAGSGWPGMGRGVATPSFDLIDQAKMVYGLIRTAQQKTP